MQKTVNNKLLCVLFLLICTFMHGNVLACSTNDFQCLSGNALDLLNRARYNKSSSKCEVLFRVLSFKEVTVYEHISIPSLFKPKPKKIIYTEQDKLNVLKYLINKGYDINERHKKKKMSPLDMAIQLQLYEIVWYIIDETNQVRVSSANLTNAYNLVKDRFAKQTEDKSEIDLMLSDDGLLLIKLEELLKGQDEGCAGGSP